MFGLIGLVFGLVFGVTKFSLRNAVRVASFGLVGYLVYELIIGYTQGREAAKSASPAPVAPAAPRAPATQSATGSSTIVGGGDHAGQAVKVRDAGGVQHTTRVGRGVIRR